MHTVYLVELLFVNQDIEERDSGCRGLYLSLSQREAQFSSHEMPGELSLKTHLDKQLGTLECHVH